MSNATPLSIAIVGFSGVFPKAVGNDLFWRNIDATIDVPMERWALAGDQFLQTEGVKPDSAYSRRACLVQGFEFDASGFHLSKGLLERIDPEQVHN